MLTLSSVCDMHDWVLRTRDVTQRAVVGALYRQCDDNGKCQCKRGVTGDKCDRCDVNFYDFGQSGCRSVSG